MKEPGRSPRNIRSNVLAVGAHPDDIELACGGTLLWHRAQGDDVTMLVMTNGELGAGDAGRRAAEARQATESMGIRLLWGPFSDGRIPLSHLGVDVVEEVIYNYDIDTVYVHSPNDTHSDHLLTAQTVLGAARRVSRVLHYQSPSTYTFNPTVFVDIEAHLEGKIKALGYHRSQVHGSPTVDLEAVRATARYWGNRSRMDYAEGFEPHRFIWSNPDHSKDLSHEHLDEDALTARLLGLPGQPDVHGDPHLDRPAKKDTWDGIDRRGGTGRREDGADRRSGAENKRRREDS